MIEFEWPNVNQQTVIVGRNGTGKTQQAFYVLSKMPFDQMPFCIMDFKRDELLNSSRKIKSIGYNEVPKHPGLYIIHCDPHHKDAIKHWFHRIWKQGRVGLFVDEGYMVPESEEFNAILTQGRSLRIPRIILSQRPAWLSRFVLSEADHYSFFHLNDAEDRKKIGRFLPQGAIEERLPEYHALWYASKKDALFHLQPVPDGATILDDIETRLTPRRRAI